MVKQTTKWRAQRLSSNNWDAGTLFVFPSLFFSLRGIQMAGGKIMVCIAQYQTHARNHIYVRWLVSLAGFVWVLYWAAIGFLCFWVCFFCCCFFFPAIPSMQHSDSRELLFHDTSNQRQQVVFVRCDSRQTHRPLGTWMLHTGTFWLRKALLSKTPDAGCWTCPCAMRCELCSLPASTTLIISVQSLCVACCSSGIVRCCHSEPPPCWNIFP